MTLAKGIADQLHVPFGKVDISYFANGEKRIWVTEPVKGENVVLVQSFSSPADEHIVEFLLLSDALERMGARHINAVIPWMGYSLQDKVFREGEPIAAKVVANMISSTYTKRVFLLDLHNSSTPGFFSVPTQHLSATDLFIEYVQKTFGLENIAVASPDFGGLKRARTFAEKLSVPLVNIDKSRNLHTGEAKALGLSGDVKGKTVLIFDDVINSGSTIVETAEIVKEHGAKSVHFLATHGIFANHGAQRVQDSLVDSVVVTNSIPQSGRFDKIKVIDASKVFAEALTTWVGN